MNIFTLTKSGRTLLLTAVLSLSAVLWGGCDNPANNDGGSYETVSLVGLKWMKKNLNVQTEDSWCYGEGSQVYDYDTGVYVTLTQSQIQTNCNTYGRLYTWEAAKRACQSVGMRLPTRYEWWDLMTAVNVITSGIQLKSKHGWNHNGNGTDDFGFSALPGGSYHDGSFFGVGYDGNWWTDTEVDDYYPYRSAAYSIMSSNRDYVRIETYSKSDGYSVRCVK